MLHKQLLPKTLLLWDPEDIDRFGLNPSDFEHMGIQTLQSDYARIGRDPNLSRRVKEIGPEAILFTRNEDMSKQPLIGAFLREVRAGYTCLSGIDPEQEEAQTRRCIRDFLNKAYPVELPEHAPPKQILPAPKGTCSFIFDLEQFGGARYGMPRILPLIESYGIRATFFVTGFIAAYYPEVLQRIVTGGHEIAVHGSVHEFLQDRSLGDQVERLRGQAGLLSNFSNVTGANFIFRMDPQTPEAMTQAGIKYFVLFRKNVFYRTRFIQASGRARTFGTPSGYLYMIPVGVETYGLPRAEIGGAINSCFRVARKENTNHISVLMHPFKDGALNRLESTRWLIERLVRDLSLKPIPLNEISAPSIPDGHPIRVKYNVGDARVPKNSVNRFTKSWWIPEVYHLMRTERLADSLDERNQQVALAPETLEGETEVCVYPDGFDDAASIYADPISGRDAADQVLAAAKEHNSLNLLPGSLVRDMLNCALFHIPRTLSDWKVLVLRIWSKISKALTLGETFSWKAK